MAQARLLDVAITEFGLKGLEGASTRGIAQAAGTAMSSITYHYGGKDGLYLAAADHIADQMAGEMASALVAEHAIARDDATGARAAIHRIFDRFVEVMAGEASAARAMFIIREQMSPTEAFDRIYAGVMGQMLERIVELACVTTGIRDRSAAGVATVTLMGQVMVLRVAPAATLRLLGLRMLDAATLAALRQRIRINTDAILDAMIAERQGNA